MAWVGPGEELLVGTVGDRRVAFRAADVVEVQRMVAIEPLPRAPSTVLGVINVRGTVVPVVSVAARFGQPSPAPGIDDRLVIVDVRDRRVALHVGPDLDLRAVDPAAVDEVPREAAGYAGAVVRLPDGVLVVHDLAEFLDRDDAIALDEAVAGAGGESA